MVSDSSVQRLKATLHGTVLTPRDQGYDAARMVWNIMIDRRPALIARCADAVDVTHAIHFAREHGLVASIRGGGHNVAGNAVCDDGLMIDLSRMKEIRVDHGRRVADAQPGVTLGEFDAATQAVGLATTLGTVSMTGIAGLTLGGGLGWLMGKHGLACDNVLSMEVVTAEGDVRTASASEHEDLFWALRGAGSNFGVVTNFRYRLHPLGAVLSGMVAYPLARAKEVLRFYRDFVTTCPDELIVHAGILNGPDGSPIVAFPFCHCGALEEGEKLIAPMRRLGSPAAEIVTAMPYVQVQQMFDASFPANHHNYWKAGFMPALSDDTITALIDDFSARPSPGSLLFIEHLHGAVTRVPVDATAFPYRGEHFSVLAIAIWPDAAHTDANLQWIRRFWTNMERSGAAGVYVNYLSQEGDVRARAAYGPNYPRLAALKAKYDPGNFFRMNQNIEPAVVA